MPNPFDSFQDAVSPSRLQPYRKVGDAAIDTVSRYLWNACLCESLYFPLQHLEVTLRNSLHDAISSHQTDPLWLHERTSWLQRREQNKIRDAKQRLNLPSPTQGQVIAELTFGFWTGLFNTDYEQVLWPRLVVRVFPQFPPNRRARQTISKRLNETRQLRNRIFHHEPIWNDPNLLQDYSNILETLEWLNPTMHSLVKACETFPTAYTPQKLAQIKASIQPHI